MSRIPGRGAGSGTPLGIRGPAQVRVLAGPALVSAAQKGVGIAREPSGSTAQKRSGGRRCPEEAALPLQGRLAWPGARPLLPSTGLRSATAPTRRYSGRTWLYLSLLF